MDFFNRMEYKPTFDRDSKLARRGARALDCSRTDDSLSTRLRVVRDLDFISINIIVLSGLQV